MNPVLIGLTGAPGTGKSTVAEMLARRGAAAVVVGDELGRRALRRFPELKDKLRRRYGDAIFTSRGALKRRALGRIVFTRKGEAAWLNRLMFPKIYELLRGDIKRLSKTHRVIVVDAAMIYEWGIEKDFDLIWVVTAPLEMAEARMASGGRLSADEVRMRLAAQVSPREKARRANRVIANNGSKRQLREAVDRAWKSQVQPRLSGKTGG
jgi:dephospho-CoA kinase